MPFSFWSSSARCHATMPVATTGMVEIAANSKLKYAAAASVRFFVHCAAKSSATAADKKRDRKMDQHHVLRVLFQQHLSDVERMLRLASHCTMTWPVIFGWIEQKYG